MKNCNKKDISIYVHVPFCNGKCYYCNFFSVIGNCKQKDEYFSHLNHEIINKLSNLKNYKIKSIYIGGGTPSSIDEKYISNLLKIIKENCEINEDAEITIECNPNSISETKLLAYKNAGINRVSYGVQSLNNGQLKQIGRLHNKIQAIDAIKLAKKVGFSNISADILLGLPKQTKLKIKHEVKKLIKNGVTHISAYMLILEENTKLFNLVNDKKITLPTEDNTVKIYNYLRRLLKKFNFYRYEVSNFAKYSNDFNYESVHNKTYWQAGEYLGFGTSAHSYINGKRYYNFADFKKYYNCVDKNILPKTNYEIISKSKKIEELIMLGLRTNVGVGIKKLGDLDYDILSIKEKELTLLLNHNMIKIENGYISVCEDYFGVLNQIILKLI